MEYISKEMSCHCGWSGHPDVDKMTLRDGRIAYRARCKNCTSKMGFLQHNKPLEEREIYFGKHKGKKLVDVPKDYLRWTLDNVDLSGGLRKNIIEVLGKDIST